MNHLILKPKQLQGCLCISLFIILSLVTDPISTLSSEIPGSMRFVFSSDKIFRKFRLQSIPAFIQQCFKCTSLYLIQFNFVMILLFLCIFVPLEIVTSLLLIFIQDMGYCISLTNTEKKRLSWCQLCRHWCQQRLPYNIQFISVIAKFILQKCPKQCELSFSMMCQMWSIPICFDMANL